MDYRIKAWAFQDQRITVWSAAELEAEEDHIGELGSPTIVSGLEQAPSRERKREFLEGTPDGIALQLAEILQDQLGG